jgi:hypothetical protein
MLAFSKFMKYLRVFMSIFTRNLVMCMFVITACFHSIAKADTKTVERLPVTSVKCLPEVNFFMLYTASLNGDEGDIKTLQDNYPAMERDNKILTPYNRSIQECKLKNTTLKFQIDYTPSVGDNKCEGDFHAKAKLWRDEELILDLKYFDYHCNHPYYINNIVYKHTPDSKTETGQLLVGGLNYDSDHAKIFSTGLVMDETSLPLTDRKIVELQGNK